MSTMDLANKISPVETISPDQHTATQTGDAVDREGFHSAAVVLQVGTVADDAFSVEVQEADDDGSGSPDTWAAVDDDDLDGTEPGTLTADTITVIGYRGNKRHLRVVATDDGTADANFGAVVVLGNPRKAS